MDAYKQAVKEEWERAAHGWHRWISAINTWLNLATETMLDQANVKDGSRVIDIAAGDGGQSVAAAGRVGSSGEVLATAIAPEFVKLANSVASRWDLTQLRAEVMDAESLTLPADQFDAAISRLGLMYLPDLQKGLSEIKRVLRPARAYLGGRVHNGGKDPLLFHPGQVDTRETWLAVTGAGATGTFQSWRYRGSCWKLRSGGLPGHAEENNCSTASVCFSERVRAMARLSLLNNAADAERLG